MQINNTFYRCLFFVIIMFPTCCIAGSNTALETKPNCSIWVDKFDDMNVSLLLRENNNIRLVDRIIYPMFVDGQAVYKTSSNHRDKKKQIYKLISIAHKYNIKIYGYFDCFNWGMENERHSKQYLSKYNFKSVSKYLFADPLDPNVRNLIANHIYNIAVNYPQLDGILLSCRIPLILYDKNNNIKNNYINNQIINDTDELYKDIDKETIIYRNKLEAEIIDGLCNMYHLMNQRSKIAVIAYAHLYQPNQSRNLISSDWIPYVKSGLIDETFIYTVPDMDNMPNGNIGMYSLILSGSSDNYNNLSKISHPWLNSIIYKLNNINDIKKLKVFKLDNTKYQRYEYKVKKKEINPVGLVISDTQTKEVLGVHNISYMFLDVNKNDKIEVTHNFDLKNEYRYPVTIDQIKTSCGCTSVLINNKKLPFVLFPGESIEILIKMKINSEDYGDIKKRIWVYIQEQNEAAAIIDTQVTIK